jgi:hypothetical protein
VGPDGSGELASGELRLAGPGRVLRVLAPGAAALSAAIEEPERAYRAALL